MPRETMKSRGLVKLRKAYAGHWVIAYVHENEVAQRVLDGWERA